MRRILVLDDEPAVVNALRRTLRSAFPKDAVVIETFDEPEAAVLRAGEQEFDVVISDFRMPGLNGADVLQLVKGLQPDAIRIVVSATTEFVDIMAAVNRAEIFRYMTKPWDQEDLVATVREAFGRRDSLVQARLEQSPGLTQGQRDLQQLEQEEPGITRVNWDENGNIRLF
jgi:DNA-binding NtrC family response regulator